jgi:hypothetical protein
MAIRLRKAINWLLIAVGAATLLIGLMFGAFGIVVSRVPEYRVQLQNWINERGGIQVEFKKLSARLRLYGPELVFDQAIVRTPDGARVLATAKRGSVAFDLWSSISHARLTAGRFSLESPELGLIRTKEGRIQLLGLSALPDRDKPFALEELPMGRFYVRDAVVTFRDAITGRGPWSLSGVNFDVTRDSRLLELRGDAELPRGGAGPFRVGGRVAGCVARTGDGTRQHRAAWRAQGCRAGAVGGRCRSGASDRSTAAVVECAARRGAIEHGRGEQREPARGTGASR